LLLPDTTPCPNNKNIALDDEPNRSLGTSVEYRHCFVSWNDVLSRQIAWFSKAYAATDVVALGCELIPAGER
jgi:hypothetical protein